MKPSENPEHWAAITSEYRLMRASVLDYERVLHLISSFNRYKILFVPILPPDDATDMRFLGDVLAINKNDEVVARLVVSEAVDWNGVSGVLNADFEVHPDHRRRGLMTEMFDVSGEYFGMKFAPPEHFGLPSSADAKAFWRTRSAL